MVDIEGVFKVVSEDLGGAMEEDATSEPDSTNDKTDVNHNELLTEEPVDAAESWGMITYGESPLEIFIVWSKTSMRS